MDLSDLGYWDQIEASLHGDHKPLIALLRSREPLSQAVREYIAEQLERKPKQRFSARMKADRLVRREDREIMWHVYWAKAAMALIDAKSSGCTEAEESAAIAKLHEITDDKALDWLTEHQGLYVDADRLKNARRRNKTSISNPKRRPPKAV